MSNPFKQSIKQQLHFFCPEIILFNSLKLILTVIYCDVAVIFISNNKHMLLILYCMDCTFAVLIFQHLCTKFD